MRVSLKEYLQYQTQLASKKNPDPFAEYEAAFCRIALLRYTGCRVIFCPNGSVLVTHYELPLVDQTMLNKVTCKDEHKFCEWVTKEAGLTIVERVLFEDGRTLVAVSWAP